MVKILGFPFKIPFIQATFGVQKQKPIPSELKQKYDSL